MKIIPCIECPERVLYTWYYCSGKGLNLKITNYVIGNESNECCVQREQINEIMFRHYYTF